MAISFEDAVQTLKRRFGGQYDAGDAAGRDDLVNALRDDLGISRGDAEEALDSMIAAGTIRYHQATNALPAPGAIGVGSAPTGIASGGTSGAPAIPVAVTPGYWQIGKDGAESGAAAPLARDGQVDPTQ
jgi:hypothetical protein